MDKNKQIGFKEESYEKKFTRYSTIEFWLNAHGM